MANTSDLKIGKNSHVGMSRTLNEDSFGTPQLQGIAEQAQLKYGTLVAVADGMGGHAAGEVASRMAIDALFATYYTNDGADRAKALEAAYAEANRQVHEHAATDATKTNMGSTLVAAVVKEKRMYIANVGDSRAYWVHGGRIEQVTQDHSWVATQVRAGVISKEQAERHPYKNIITRAIGNQPTVTADISVKSLGSGDMLVLCSDGLANKVTPNEILKIVTSASEPQAAVDQLIKLANERGGEDNITAIVVQMPATSNPIGFLAISAILLALLAIAILGFVFGSMFFLDWILPAATPTLPATLRPL